MLARRETVEVTGKLHGGAERDKKTNNNDAALRLLVVSTLKTSLSPPLLSIFDLPKAKRET